MTNYSSSTIYEITLFGMRRQYIETACIRGRIGYELRELRGPCSQGHLAPGVSGTPSAPAVRFCYGNFVGQIISGLHLPAKATVCVDLSILHTLYFSMYLTTLVVTTCYIEVRRMPL